MGSRAWFTQLQSNKIFKVIKESLPENVKKTQCILECKHDILYVWNQNENSILTLNLKTLNDGNKEAPFQTLVATSPPCFEASQLSVSVAETRVCAWGPRGALVVELPRRWGRHAHVNQQHHDQTFCSSVVLDERFFLSECDLRQVRWHPGSGSDSHILLLAADNTIRLYDTSAGGGSGVGAQLIRVLVVGRRPVAPLATIPLLASLGHTAVDFDVAPPAPRPGVQGSKRSALVWPLLVLRGNGDVYMVDGSVDLPGPSQPKVAGPLTMYPPADDNYGVDSCSLMVLGASATSSAGVVVAIATTNGVIYHCLLLPNNNFNDDDEDNETMINKEYDSNLNMSNLSLVDSGELSRALFVVEAIELDIGLILSDSDPSYSCPIFLKAVESCRGQYICIHEAGVHVVNVPLVAELENYINDEDAPLSVLCSYESTAMCAVCTATARRPDTANKPLGAVGANAASSKRDGTDALIVLLSDGSVLGRYMEVHHATERLFNNMSIKTRKQSDSTLAEIRKHPFDEMIRDVLKSDLSQPILKMSSGEEPSFEECLEICSNAHRSVGMRLTRDRTAISELQRRTHVLRTLLQHQKSAIADAGVLLESIKDVADTCKDKLEQSLAAQMKINERFFNVSRALRAKNARVEGSSPLDATEVALEAELKTSNAKVTLLSDQLNKVKIKMNYQEKQMKNWEEDRRRKEMYLGQTHSETIKTILDQQNAQIKNLVTDINNMKSILGLN